jgi:RND family efflux transporter MFP subunit
VCLNVELLMSELSFARPLSAGEIAARELLRRSGVAPRTRRLLGGGAHRIAVTSIPLALLCAAIIGVTAWSGGGGRAAIAGVSAPNEVPTLVVFPAARAKAKAEIVLPGTLLPARETGIYARTNGYLKRWHVDLGQRVKAGQLLAEIETPEIDRELNQATASLGQVKANLELARTTAERWKGLLAENAVSRQEVDERVAAYAARQADYAAAQASMERLQQLRSFQRVVAPFEGTITARNVEVGALIAAGSNDPSRWMFKLAQITQLRTLINVPQTHARQVRPGQGAQITLREFGDKPFAGTVVRTAGALDPQSRTLLTEIQIPNEDGAILAGSYAQVKLNVDQAEPAILLPVTALLMRTDGPQVATVEDGVVRVKKIKLGRDFGTKVEVLDGLKEKALIVANPTDAARDGAKVKTALAPPEPSPPGKPAAAPAAPAAPTAAPKAPATPAATSAAPKAAAAPAVDAAKPPHKTKPAAGEKPKPTAKPAAGDTQPGIARVASTD